MFFKAKTPVADEIRSVDSEIREPLRIEITGSNYRWEVRYPGADDQFGTEDDVLTARNVRVPLETDIIVVLKSTDYVYVLALPQFGLKEIAVPSLEFRMAFRPAIAGRFALDGDELCGDPHPELRGDLIVESRDHFLAWLNEQRKRMPIKKPL